MKGTVVNYRGRKRRKSGNQVVVQPDGVDSKEKAQALVGKTVVWTSPAKKELKGKVSGTHGNSGAVRCLFETGMPGQSLGKEVEIK